MEDNRSTDAQIARLEVEVRYLQTEVTGLRDDMKSVLSKLSTAEGSWKTLLAVAGFAGAVGSGLTKLAAVVFK
jgi:uncharacterized protein YlxW (UPF0749 family)